MALSGTFYGTTSNDRVKPKIQWSGVQSIEGNYTDITATLYYSRTNTGYATAGGWKGSLTIDGDKKEGSKNLSITYNSNTEAITHTVRVYHDSYGARTVTISAAGGIAVSSMKTTSISCTVTLDTIPRASTLSAVNAHIGGLSTVVVDRKNAAFTHSIAYRFGTESGYLKSDGSVSGAEEKLTATAINFRLPESFYGEIPNKAADTCTLTCRTYQGNTLIGTATATFTVTADPAICAPVFTATAEDIDPATTLLTGDPKVLIPGKSTVLCIVNAAAQKGATVRSITVGGMEATDSRRVLEKPTDCRIPVAVTDSRGYRTETVLTPDTVPYVPLTATAQVSREDPTSDTAILTVTGKCYKGSFGAADNTLILSYGVAGGEPVEVPVDMGEDMTYSVSLPVEDLAYTQAHSLTVTVGDTLSEITKDLTVQKGIPVFDWGENDFQFHVPVQGDFRGSFQGLFVRTVRLSDTNTLTVRAGMYPDSARQSLFLFGNDNGKLLSGVLGLSRSGAGSWQGTGGVSLTAAGDLTFTVTLPGLAFDYFTLLSAEPFEIL